MAPNPIIWAIHMIWGLNGGCTTTNKVDCSGKKIIWGFWGHFHEATHIVEQLYGVSHGILRVINTILYENEFQNPQIFQQTISLFPEHSTLLLLLLKKNANNLIIRIYPSNMSKSGSTKDRSWTFLTANCVFNGVVVHYTIIARKSIISPEG
jgi:hypothetical protein